MDITFDYIIENVNNFLLAEDIINLRIASKKFANFKILPSFNYVRILKGIKSIENFKKNKNDSYKLSVELPQKFNEKTIFYLKIILNNVPLYSLSIRNNFNNNFNNNYYQNQIIYYNTDFIQLYGLLNTCYVSNQVKYLSMDLKDFSRFSNVWNNIIKSKIEYFKNFDTLHIDMKNWEINDLLELGSSISVSFKFIKNIIIDNIQINKNDICNYLMPGLNMNNNNYESTIHNISPNVISYCYNFKYDNTISSLSKTVLNISNIGQELNYNIYYYQRDINYDHLYDQIYDNYLNYNIY